MSEKSSLQMPLKILRQIDRAQRMFSLGHEVIAAEMIIQVEENIEMVSDEDPLKEVIRDSLRRSSNKSIIFKDRWLHELLTLMHTRSKWKILKLTRSTKISYFDLSPDIISRYKLEGIIRCPLIYVLAALKEADLYNLWIPNCVSSSIVSKEVGQKQVSKIILSLYSIFQREVLCSQSYFGEVLCDGSLFMQTKSIDVDQSDPGHQKAETLAGFTLKELPGAYLYVRRIKIKIFYLASKCVC
jgi:hypothetical protein